MIIFSLLCGLMTLCINCYGGDTPWQYRLGSQYALDIDDQWSINIQEQTYIQSEYNGCYYHSGDLGLIWNKLTEHHLKIALNIKTAHQRSGGNWSNELKPHLNITYFNKIKDWNWSNRTRMEYRIRENKEDLWRFRDKLKLYAPSLIDSIKLRPYVADELFFYLNGDGYGKNRAYLGTNLTLTPSIKTDIYYFWEKEEPALGGDQLNVLAAQIKFSF